MPYFQLENIYWEYQINATMKFSTYLDSNKKYTLVLPEIKGSAYTNETFFQTITNAKVVSAKYFIIGTMSAIKDVMKISMTMYNTSDSSKVWVDTLVSRTSYDLDSILKLFADNIGTENIPSKDNTQYSLAYYNPTELVKPDASVDFGISVSGAYSIIDRVDNKASVGLGFIVSYDSKRMIFDFQGDYLLGDLEDYDNGNIVIYDIRISGSYPLINKKTTPYIGGSISFGGVTYWYPTPNPKHYPFYERGDGAGLALFANCGYLFDRNSHVKFRLAGSFIFPLYKAKTFPFNIEETQRPIGFRVNAIILF